MSSKAPNVAGGGAPRAGFDGIVDQNAFGDVVGVEILDLRSHLGSGRVPRGTAAGFPRWSYDEEIDAFYVRLTEETAPVQTRVAGTTVIDGAGVLLSLEVPVPPSRR